MAMLNTECTLNIMSYLPFSIQRTLCRETRKNYLQLSEFSNKIKSFMLYNSARIASQYWTLGNGTSASTNLNISRAYAITIWSEEERYWTVKVIYEGLVYIDDECIKAAGIYMDDNDPMDMHKAFLTIISKCDYNCIRILADAIYDYVVDTSLSDLYLDSTEPFYEMDVDMEYMEDSTHISRNDNSLEILVSAIELMDGDVEMISA